MTEGNRELFPTMKTSNEGESSLHEFPSFCPPVSLIESNDNQENSFPSLCPFPRMKKPQNRGLSIPVVNIGQNGSNKSNNFNFPPEIDCQSPNSPNSALPKLITLNAPTPKISPRGSVPASGRKTVLTPTVPKASPLKPVCLQTIIPRRRNASVLARITNVNSPLQ